MEGRSPHQLLEVVLHRVGVHHHANGHQGVKGKVEDLVAEERNDPRSMLLFGRRTNCVSTCTVSLASVLGFTLYAPYVAMPQMRIMSRDIAVAMQMSARELKRNR